MRLANRVALVTGASSGIGREAVLHLAREGARLAVAARRVDRLEELAERIRSELGGEVIELPGDVTDPESTSSWVEETVDTLGGLDVLVNAAGIIATGGVPRSSTSRPSAPTARSPRSRPTASRRPPSTCSPSALRSSWRGTASA
jgi:NAD(P)-dependent dehydrogenase (short-subunit alcohol dehydrogenase family)